MQKIHSNSHTMQQKKLTRRSNIVQFKVKHNSLELSCSLYSQVQVLLSGMPSSTLSSAFLPSIMCLSFVPAGTSFQLHPEKICLCTNMQGLVQEILMLQFWKSVQVIEQKHKSNYNRLHFLIYLLHILRSISTEFSLLQE